MYIKWYIHSKHTICTLWYSNTAIEHPSFWEKSGYGGHEAPGSWWRPASAQSSRIDHWCSRHRTLAQLPRPPAPKPQRPWHRRDTPDATDALMKATDQSQDTKKHPHPNNNNIKSCATSRCYMEQVRESTYIQTRHLFKLATGRHLVSSSWWLLVSLLLFS